MTSLYLDTEYVVINCGERGNGCGMPFAVTRSFYNHIRETGEGWYCPRGHSRVFTGPSTETQLEESKARETALQDQLSAAIRDGEATRVALLRDRQRFANGVCPCCNRSFENVRRHMTAKHPDYDVTKIEGLKFRCSCGGSFDTLKGLRIHQSRRRGDDWDDPKTSKHRTWGGSHLTEVGAR